MLSKPGDVEAPVRSDAFTILQPEPIVPVIAKLPEVTMVNSIKLSVENASQKNVTGADNWAAVIKPSGAVLVQAVTGPKGTVDEWKQIKWSGGKAVPDKPNVRSVPRDVAGRYAIKAEFGDASASLTVWIVSATVRILTDEPRPKGAAPFDKGSRDGTDKLGPVTYQSIVQSVIDEQAGEFVANMGASGKIAAVGTLSPKGVSKVVSQGWTIRRQLMVHTWVDGIKDESRKAWCDVWTDDTSSPAYRREAPDADEQIYDLDAPDIRWGEKSYETYNNFRQWVEWNNDMCSDYAPWSWQAQWKLDRRPEKQIELNSLQPKNVPIPDKPHYPSGASRKP
jgi:hypothetical protein